VGRGFDHLRIGLSVAVWFWQSFPLSYGLKWSTAEPVALYAPLIASVLPMFFALSGFLVMRGALRINNLRTFIVFRTLRICRHLEARQHHRLHSRHDHPATHRPRRGPQSARELCDKTLA